MTQQLVPTAGVADLDSLAQKNNHEHQPAVSGLQISHQVVDRPVHLFHRGGGQMHIDHGALEGPMAEEGLNRTEAFACFEQMRGVRITKRMTSGRLLDPTLVHIGTAFNTLRHNLRRLEISDHWQMIAQLHTEYAILLSGRSRNQVLR